MYVKRNNILLSAIIVIFLLSNSVVVRANKYTLSPKANIHAGIAESKGVWTNVDETTSTSYTPITKKYKTVVTKIYDKASGWYTGIKPVSDNYYHKKKVNDCHATNCINRTHTFSATAAGEVKDFTIGLGYTYSISTSKSVTNDLDPNSKTGYYYFGVKAHARDFRVITKTEKYKKVKGSYVGESYSSRANGNAALYNNPLYYKWYKSKT